MGTQAMTIKRFILRAVVATGFVVLFLLSGGCQPKSSRVYKVAYSQGRGVPGDPQISNEWELQENWAVSAAERQALPASHSLNIIEPPRASQVYHIGPGDVVQLKIFQLLDLNREEVLVQEVDRRGLIYVPLLNYVPAAGLTSEQLRAELVHRLGQEFIRDPQVEVKIQRFGSKEVMVLGAVSRPGSLVLDSDSAPLLDVISQVGGINNSAAPDIEILRGAYQPERYGNGMLTPVGFDSGENGYNSREIVPVSMLFARGEGQLNPMIYPGDVVKVPHESEGYIYVSGEVEQPGAKSFRRPLTIMQAITCAGGLKFTAEERECQIIRRTATGAEQVLTVDLKKISAGTAANILMAQNDTVVLKANGWKKFLEGLDHLFQRTVRVGADVTYDAGGEMGIPTTTGIRR